MMNVTACSLDCRILYGLTVYAVGVSQKLHAVLSCMPGVNLGQKQTVKATQIV